MSASAQSPLFTFPVKRRISTASTTSSGASSIASILERSGSSNSSSTAPSSPGSDYSDKELALKEDITGNCIGKEYCKCKHCHIGDFVFESEEEFLIYYDALKDVLDAKASGNPIRIHCTESGGQHLVA